MIKKKANHFNKEANKGFTIVEALIAVVIFSVSILAVMTLVSDDISDIGYVKKKITASYLAQEGVEYVRNLRDAYVLYDPDSAQDGWNDFRVKIGPCNTTSNPNKSCYFHDANLFSGGTMINIAVSACGGDCPTLYKSSGGGYEYNVPGTVEGFIREIKTEEITQDEIRVSSTVYWTQESGIYNVTFSADLFNWVE